MDKNGLTEQFIKDTLDSLRSAKNFVLDQAPDVLKQIIQWNIAEAMVWLFFGVAFLVFSIWCFRIFRREAAKDSPDDGVQGGSIVMGIISLAVGTGFFISNLLDILKCYVAPKVFLIEYFANLMKSAPHGN